MEHLTLQQVQQQHQHHRLHLAAAAVAVEEAAIRCACAPFFKFPGFLLLCRSERRGAPYWAGARAGSTDAAARWLIEATGCTAEGAKQIVSYVQETQRVLGCVPTKDTVVAERFFGARRAAHLGRGYPRAFAHGA